jgi:uncharacterized protein
MPGSSPLARGWTNSWQRTRDVVRPDAVLTVHPPSNLKVRRDSAAELRVAMTVADGYHVQANPASHDFLIPLQLKLRPGGGIRPGQSAYPPAQPYSLPGFPEPLLTYEGRLEIMVPLAVQGNAQRGKQVLTGTIRYQACDSRTCLFPARARFNVPLEILDMNTGDAGG